MKYPAPPYTDVVRSKHHGLHVFVGHENMYFEMIRPTILSPAQIFCDHFQTVSTYNIIAFLSAHPAQAIIFLLYLDDNAGR